jgi:hypothetical protein
MRQSQAVRAALLQGSLTFIVAADADAFAKAEPIPLWAKHLSYG